MAIARTGVDPQFVRENWNRHICSLRILDSALYETGLFKLAAIGDEISPRVNQQIRILRDEKIGFIEVRKLGSRNVSEIQLPSVMKLEALLRASSVGVSSLASIIGKMRVSTSVKTEQRVLRRVLANARVLHSKHVRIFSLRTPLHNRRVRSSEVERLTLLSSIAHQESVTLLLENEIGTYADTPEHCLELLDAVNSDHLRLNFDPGNFVRRGVRPYSDAYRILKHYVSYLHLKDVSRADGGARLLGHGDGQFPTLLAALRDDEFDGFLSLEPHLRRANARGGYSGPQMFRLAAKAYNDLLESLNLHGRPTSHQ